MREELIRQGYGCGTVGAVFIDDSATVHLGALEVARREDRVATQHLPPGGVLLEGKVAADGSPSLRSCGSVLNQLVIIIELENLTDRLVIFDAADTQACESHFASHATNISIRVRRR